MPGNYPIRSLPREWQRRPCLPPLRVKSLLISMSPEEPSATDAELLQIGEVAERVGLSLRTVRYYEEVELLTPHDAKRGWVLYECPLLPSMREPQIQKFSLAGPSFQRHQPGA